MLFDDYQWRFCGTVALTDKKLHIGLDVLFVKLSKGALRLVDQGWFREAVVEQKTKTGKKFWIQASTWQDKKQVLFIHTNKVGLSKTEQTSHQVRRSVKGKKRRIILNAPQSQKDYAANFNAVDRNDRDSADYTTSISTHRWYLHLFCWVLDCVVHVVYVVVCYLYKDSVGAKEWKKYTNRHYGCRDFQVDLGIALLNHAIELEWMDTSKPRPDWMRQSTLVPCDCGQCYFCLNGMTSGIHHCNGVVVYVRSDGKKVRTSGCMDEKVNIMGKSGAITSSITTYNAKK